MDSMEKKEEKQKEKEEVLHDFNPSEGSSMNGKKFIAIIAVSIILGVGTGYFASQKGSASTGAVTSQSGNAENGKGTIIGSTDTKTFKDTAQGVLEKGGVNGEGQFHLVRPGGDSQNVYVTSSIVDLSQFVKKKIKVWGQTNASQTAGWLMDVGRVQVLN